MTASGSHAPPPPDAGAALAATTQKVEHFLDRVRALRAGDFAQEDSEEALQDVERRFADYRAQLAALSAGTAAPDLALNHCRIVLGQLFAYLPILGFLHRSKSASNAFELYHPLRELARQLLGPTTRLILSSEWAFSPYTYPRMHHFPQYVLIGLPASESRNALLLPLAGHELGHSAWLRRGLGAVFKPLIRDALVAQIRARIKTWRTLFPNLQDESALDRVPEYLQAWYPPYDWAQRQCEELFCDLLGLLLFETAYPLAFSYLLAPGLPGARPPHYPSLTQRAQYLTGAAAAVGITMPPDYAARFPAVPPAQTGVRDEFLMSLADEATKGLQQELLRRAQAVVAAAHLPPVTPAEVTATRERFTILAPADAPTSLVAPVNAAWQLANQPDLWADYPKVEARRHAVLSELVAKSAQVLEYNVRTRAAPVPP